MGGMGGIGMAEAPDSRQSQDSDRVMARDLPDCTESTLKAHFGQFGTVVDVYIPKDHATKASRGFAYVKFASASMADEALSAPHTLDGVKINVVRAQSRNKGSAGTASDGPVPAPLWGLQQPMMSLGVAHQQPMMSLGATQQQPMSMGLGASQCEPRIFVGGVPEVLGEAEMRSHFSAFGQVVDVYFPKGKGRGGFCFVKFASPSMAMDAVAKSSRQIGEHVISEIRIADPKPGSSGGGNEGGYGGGSSFGNYGSPSGPMRGGGQQRYSPY